MREILLAAIYILPNVIDFFFATHANESTNYYKEIIIKDILLLSIMR